MDTGYETIWIRSALNELQQWQEHRTYLPSSMRAQFEAVVMGPVMIVSCRNDLTPLDQDRPEGENHWTLGSRVGTLRQIKLCLVH